MKKIISMILAVCLVVSLAVFAMSASADSIGYQIKGTYNEGQNRLTISVYVNGLAALGGRLGLDYDEEQLSPVSSGQYLAQTVLARNSITITNEAYSIDDYFSKTDGYLLFAWYYASGSIDTTVNALEICQIRFDLKDGVELSDLDSNSIKLWHVDSNKVSWNSSAEIRDKSYAYYKNGVAGYKDCAVSFEYPGSDIIPINAHKVALLLKDSKGAAISGNVIIGTTNIEIGSDGVAEIMLADGTYTYRAYKANYGEKTGEIVVNGADVTLTVNLATSQEIVKQVAEVLEIDFAEGDSITAVTKNLNLPMTGEDGSTISWTSSHPDVINQYGSIYPASSAVVVKLTATVSKDGFAASKEFVVTVLAKDTVTPNTPVFTDLAGYDWAKQAINTLYSAGVIKGTSTTTYSPGRNVTRGEFITMLMRLLNPQDLTVGAGFDDVAADSYCYDATRVAKALGIAQGEGGNLFRPNGTITRQDMMTLTYRALVKLGYMDEATGSTPLADFKDGTSVAAYAQIPVSALIGAGYIEGVGDNMIMPLKDLSRAEAAMIIYRIFVKL